MSDLTGLFEAADAGDRDAIDRLLVVMYDDLRQMAHRRLRASDRRLTLETTGLVHEAYLRLLKAGRIGVTNRNHFLQYSARVMRSVIVDLVRKHQAERRGGAAIHVTLDTSVGEDPAAAEEQLIRINEALEELGHAEPRLVQVVEMRYFVGLDEAEIAEALGVNVRTVRRDWQKARLLLKAALGSS